MNTPANTPSPLLSEGLLIVTIRGLGGCSLRELCQSFAKEFPTVEPATLHDTLNNLLASGRLVLTRDGIYRVP